MQTHVGGSHDASSLSPFVLFRPRDTATNTRESFKSFAYAWRGADVHAKAPERHASARGSSNQRSILLALFCVWREISAKRVGNRGIQLSL